MPTPGKLDPELSLVQGDTTTLVFNLTSDGVTPVGNISGYTYAMQLRTTPGAVSAAATLTCSVTDATNAQVTCVLSASDAAALTANTSYYYDLQQTDTSSKKTTLISGITQPLIAEVTRP
jgi:hypothetical protein